MKHPLAKRLVLFLALSALLGAADTLTGKWAGSFDVEMGDGQTMKGRFTLSLTQDGSTLKGQVGPEDGQQSDIVDGKVDGNHITFASQTEGPLMKFDLHLEEGHLRGLAQGDMEGSTIKAKLDVTRAPAE